MQYSFFDSNVRVEPVEPWLSSCRAVEAPSRRCRGAVEALPVEPVERPVEFLSSLMPDEADSVRLGVD